MNPRESASDTGPEGDIDPLLDFDEEPTARVSWLSVLRTRRGAAMRQAPSLFALLVAIALVISLPDIEFHPIEFAIVGISSIITATALAILVTLTRYEHRYTILVIPILDIIGFAFFRASTGGAGSIFGSLILIPVVWLASAPGRRWVWIVAGLAALAQLLPYVLEPPTSGAQWLRGVITPAVFAVIAYVVNESARMQRERAVQAERLVAERSLALVRIEEVVEELRASERRYHQLLETFRSVWKATTEQAVIALDGRARVVAWNPGATRMFGASEEEAIASVDIATIFPQRELEALAALDPAVGIGDGDGMPRGIRAILDLADRDSRVDLDVELVTAKGDELPMRLTVTPRLDGDDHRAGYLFVATDESRAAEVARLKDEFVGMISHELRTPLSSILGYIDLLKDDPAQPLTDEQLRFLGIMERNAERLLRLVGDLLFTAQVQAQHVQLDETEVDVVELARASLETVSPAAALAGVEVELQGATSEPVRLTADAPRLGQAIDNLLSNAIKFTPRGGRVTLTLGSDAEHVRISISDTGVGIPADEVEQLFTRFFRASTARRNAIPGVGLGLVITNAIVVAHGGEISVESEEGVGTTFTLTLPRSRSREA